MRNQIHTPLTALSALLCSVVILSASPVENALSLRDHRGSYYQDFHLLGGHELPNSPTVSLPLNAMDGLMPGWAAYIDDAPAEQYRCNNGNLGYSGIYSYGNVDGRGGALDRALGLLSSTTRSEPDKIEVQLAVENDTGKRLDDFKISYVGQQWRIGSFSAARLVFSYKVVDKNGRDLMSWTSLPNLSFNSIKNGKPANLNAMSPENQTVISAQTIRGLVLAPGEIAILSWKNEGHLGHGLAIDNLSLQYD